jgi:glycosyltransferase involved in cell wall biosynthesis
MKKKVMIFCESYLPSFTSGGGMWTVVNLVDRFCDQLDFYVVTNNRDLKGDGLPYPSVVTDEWNQRDNAKVFYLSKKSLSEAVFAKLVRDVEPDAIFLNSSLSAQTIKLLSARRKGMLSEIPIILAPCGEMSKGALSLKPYKKKLFLSYAKAVDLYRGVIWKASFESEGQEIRNVMGSDVEVWIAPDLTPRTILPDYSPKWKDLKRPGSVRFAFISRLSRKKNIHYFLERLRDIREGEVRFDIIGPLEDQAYWKECQAIIATLPQNITVEATGAFAEQTDALRRVAESHFFVLPTLNENFGYVFIEGLSAGCPIITSDRTVWTDIEDRNVGWRLPLEEPDKWTDILNHCINLDGVSYSQMSNNARRYAIEWLNETKVVEANRGVIERALREEALVAANE